MSIGVIHSAGGCECHARLMPVPFHRSSLRIGKSGRRKCTGNFGNRRMGPHALAGHWDKRKPTLSIKSQKHQVILKAFHQPERQSRPPASTTAISPLNSPGTPNTRIFPSQRLCHGAHYCILALMYFDTSPEPCDIFWPKREAADSACFPALSC